MHDRRGFRPDVEGLRAVAVLAVLLYHARVGILSGGYVGVDVFFVVSGFLITGLLWRELEHRGGIRLAAFYGRRARRILPAAVLVVVVTVVASSRWLAPLQARDVTKDGVASALYVANYRFALQQTNYLTSTAPPSPLQHYWSLAVEEQFYLLWPVTLLLAGLVARRFRKWSRGSAAAVLALVGAGSFVLSVWLTKASQPWAFFSLPTRAWELVAGGLVALAVPYARRLPENAAAVLGWVGLGAVVWSMTHLTVSSPFPGTAALVPVGGTVAVVVVGCRSPRLGPLMILGRKSAQVAGKLSYSWYLWHWPLLVLAPAFFGHELVLWQNLLLVAASGGLALLTLAFVELPVRFSPWLVAQARRGLTVGSVLSVGGVVACLLVAASLPSLQGHGIAPTATLSAGRAKVATASLSKSRAPIDPAAVELSNATAPVATAVAQSTGTRDVPANLDPTLGHARHDEAAPFVDGCLDSYTDATVRPCTFGATHSTTSVVLFGDSHATQWFPALDRVANTRDWRLLTFTKATCPPLSIELFSPVLDRSFRECDQWRTNVLARIRAVRPLLVVLAVARHYTDSLYHFQVYGPQWLQGMASMVSTIRQTGTKVVVIGAIPKPTVDVPNCLSGHLADAVACTEAASTAVSASGVAEERAAVEGAGGTYLDTRPWFCTSSTCPVIVDNLLVFRDDNHITTTYATWLAEVVGADLDVANEHT